MFAGLRCVELILLIAVVDVFCPGIELIEAVLAAGRCPTVKKRTRLNGAVFVVFGKTLPAECRHPVALRVVEKSSRAELNVIGIPPGSGDWRGLLGRYDHFGCERPGYYRARHATQQQ